MKNKMIDELLKAVSKDQSENINLSEQGFQFTKYPVYSEATENSLFVCRVILKKKIPSTFNTKESDAEKFLMIESHDTTQETNVLQTHDLETICPLYVLHTSHKVQSENAWSICIGRQTFSIWREYHNNSVMMIRIVMYHIGAR